MSLSTIALVVSLAGLAFSIYVVSYQIRAHRRTRRRIEELRKKKWKQP